MKVLPRIIKKVLDKRLYLVELHEYLHGYRAKRGCGTGILEAKLVQQLAFVKQCPLYCIFIDLRKAYSVLGRGGCLEILRNCGV